MNSINQYKINATGVSKVKKGPENICRNIG